jgi:hypothetical protein
MSDDEEKLKYQLEKYRQKKLQQELEEIRKFLNDYREKQEKNKNKRRRENIYVLFALAIIGGFLTVIRSNSTLKSPSFVAAFTIFAATSLIFVFLKINTVTIAESSTFDDRFDRINELPDYLFVFSLNGIILMFAAYFALTTLNIDITAAPSNVFAVGVGIGSTIITYLFEIYKEKRKKKIQKDKRNTPEEIKEEIRENIISGVKNIENASSQKEEMDEFSNISIILEKIKYEFDEPEDVDPILEEIEELESVSDGIADSLEESVTKARKEIRDKAIKKATIEEKIERIEQEYEQIAFDEE